MRSPAFFAALLVALSGATPPSASARTFTDDQGRTTDAELAGVMGDEIVLMKQGVAIRWPVAKLSAVDQAYVREWAATPRPTPRVQVRLWEREGFSPAGTFSDDSGARPGLPNIPGLHEVEKKDTYQYYDADLTNSGDIQAGQLSFSYQMYVITASGNTVVETSTEVISPIDPKQRITVPTKAISSTRTKTTSLTLSANAFGNLTTGQATSREKERFGGVWARVYGGDGKLVGEARDLIPEIERMKPAWIAPAAEQIPTVESLDEFDGFVEQVNERLEKIKKFLEARPRLPKPGTGRPRPPRPPGLPRLRPGPARN